MFQRCRLRILSSLAGALIGYLLLHPYTMLVYTLMPHLQNGSMLIPWQDLDVRALVAFHPVMVPMAVSFAVFGGVIGLLIGAALDKRKQLTAAEHEIEKKMVAMDTLEQVMVTIAHHLLNANMIAGGKVRHCRKSTSDPEILASLEVIEEQGRKIDAVIGALRRATEIKTADYTTGGTVKMMDITKEIEEQVEQAKDHDGAKRS